MHLEGGEEPIGERLQDDKVVGALLVIDDYLKGKYRLTASDVLSLAPSSKDIIPLSVFSNRELSTFEIVVRYSRDFLGMRYNQIAKATLRDPRTIWCTYSNSKRKCPAPLEIGDGPMNLSLCIFSDRRYSPLESLIIYLHDTKGLPFRQISSMLLKSYQTIWTTYRKARRKKDGS